jgi:uncharacterized protein YraI
MKYTIYSLAALVLCAPLAAQAAEGWVVDDISLQAGPDPSYPSILELTAGTPVAIEGCIDGWTWCDVAVGDARGWVPGTFLEEDYGGQRVVVIDYGPQIAIPVVGFSLGLYWDQHYHSRPFYTQRETWVAKAVRPSAPPRPAPAALARAKVAPATAPAPASSKQPTVQQRQTATTEQRHNESRATMTARTTAAQRPESVPAVPKPQARPAQPEPKVQAAKPEATTVAKAKPRQGEPKAKDELKKPKPKDDHGNQGGGDNGGR